MKKWMMLLLALIISWTVYSQGIEFQHESYAEVLKMAKKQKKLVFVDIYTSWCGPCKHMAKEIFPKAEVGTFYNAHFLNLQLDAEKNEDGKMVASKFKVTGFPTFLFIDGNGELVYRFMGGRPEDRFIAEGRQALEAFAARPQLKKYAAQYERGNRDKAFLEQYFILEDKSGLDCSDVLLDYFTLLDDEQLLDSVQIPRIAKVTVYNEAFARRVVEAACKKATDPAKDKKQFTALNKALCSFLSACLQATAKSEDPASFEAVLTLKERLFRAAGNHDSATSASLGGGNIYIPSDLSRMNYYSAHRMTERFLDVYHRYMQAIQKKYEATKSEKQAIEKAMEDKMKAAEEKGDNGEYDAVKKMSAMLFAFSSIDDYYVSTSMIENVERYEEFYAGAKDDTYKNQVAAWYIFLHQMSPSAKTAVYVAGKLLELERKQEAIGVLVMGLEKGAKAVGVEEKDVEECKAKLEELKS